jgi:hypothetical protein
MKKWGLKQRMRATGVFLVALVTLIVVVGFKAYTEFAYVCENTGSRKGHREWFFGRKTHVWYYRSPLELFMQQTHPEHLEHRWMSYAGTGKNLFGQSMSYGHGKSPLSQLRYARDLEAYFATLPPERKLELYRVFSTGDRTTVQASVDELVEGSMAITLDRR